MAHKACKGDEITQKEASKGIKMAYKGSKFEIF
jgi:hypothetical protein